MDDNKYINIPYSFDAIKNGLFSMYAVSLENQVTQFISSIKNQKIKSISSIAFKLYSSINKSTLNAENSYFFLSACFYILKASQYKSSNNKNHLIGEVSSYINDHYTEISTDISGLSVQLNEIKTKSAAESVEASKKFSGKAAEVFDKVNDAYFKVGADTIGKKYEQIARKEENAKRFWLVLLILIGCLALNSFTNITDEALRRVGIGGFDLYKAIFLLLIKISAVIIYIFSFVWAAKKYGLARDNAIVYRHLETVLDTFKYFYETSGDEHRGIIMMEAVKAVFPAPVENRKNSQLNNAEVLDVVKLLTRQTPTPGNP